MLDNSLKCTGGESFKEVEQRMNEVIENIIKHNNGKKVVIVSHGASIKYYLKNIVILRTINYSIIKKNLS